MVGFSDILDIALIHKNHCKKQKTDTIIASEYYLENRNALKKNAKNKYRNLSEEEKEVKRECQRDRYYMNTDLNEKLNKYQRNCYDSKKIRK